MDKISEKERIEDVGVDLSTGLNLNPQIYPGLIMILFYSEFLTFVDVKLAVA